MTYIYNGDLSSPIEDSAQWREVNGTLHPGNEPKAGIPGMVLVNEGARPDTALNHVPGTFTVQLVNSVPTKIWNYTPKTAQELSAATNTQNLAALLDIRNKRERQTIIIEAEKCFTPEQAEVITKILNI